MRLIIVILGFSFVGLTGCSLLDTSDSNDSGLAGVWFRIDTLDTSQPEPKLEFSGSEIELYEDAESDAGTMFPIGINSYTGELARIDNPNYITFPIQEVKEDYFVRINPYNRHGMYETVHYDISAHTLTLKFDNGLTRSYNRARLGYAPVDGYDSQLGVDINGVPTQPTQVVTRPPSASARIIDQNENETHFEFGSPLDIKDNAEFMINFSYDDGTDHYTIREGDVIYYFREGRDEHFFLAADADSSGYVRVDDFDTENNRISGSFAFRAVSSDGELRTFTDGTFDLPVYE
ncbi:hypothetical protein QA596_07140 [Balneolales bacterium ANBcel1]|nr:hypothetical protein [Balneolales bacterium ANBcel1]